MKLLDTTHTLYIPEKAEEIVVEMKINDPEWEYKVCHDPKNTGFSFIDVYDEDGEFVERM